MAGGNIETAVSLYVDHQSGGGLHDKATAGDDDINFIGTTMKENSKSIKSLSEEKGSIGNLGLNREVRSPDRTRRMCLMDYDDGIRPRSHPMLGPMTMDSVSGIESNGNEMELMMNPFAS